MALFKPNVEKLEAKEDIKGLIEALRYKDSEVRCNAAIALGNLGDTRAVKPLIHALQDENSNIQVQAAMALGKIGDPEAVEPLIQALKDEDGYYARGSIVRALRDLGDTRAIRPLTQALKDNNANVWMIAAEALVRMGWKPSNEFEQIPYLIVAQK